MFLLVHWPHVAHISFGIALCSNDSQPARLPIAK